MEAGAFSETVPQFTPIKALTSGFIMIPKALFKTVSSVQC